MKIQLLSQTGTRNFSLLNIALVSAVISILGQSRSSFAQEKVSFSQDTRFALALFQGVKAYNQAERFNSTTAFDLPILKAHRILAQKTLQDGTTWLQIERGGRTNVGWVDQRFVEIWNNRHALKPTEQSGESLPAYCKWEHAQRAVSGIDTPCMNFGTALLRKMGTKSALPVLNIAEVRTLGKNPSKFLEVLVPTLYSNIAPVTSSVQTQISTLEVMILIDATGSMRNAIAGSKEAIKQVVQKVSQFKLTTRFLVVAYRDTVETNCPVMESSGKTNVNFGTASDAYHFLDKLEACGGGDDPEAIWDALYLLKGANITRGAHRLLLLVGDAPAQPKTRGGTWFNMTVPKDRDGDAILGELYTTLGQTTTFVSVLVSDDKSFQKTAELIYHGGSFYDKANIDASSISQASSQWISELSNKVVDFLQGALKRASKFADNTNAKSCQDVLGQGSQQLALFCGGGMAEDPELAARIRDLASSITNDTIVVRHVWVPERTNLLDNVALFSHDEARKLESSYSQLSRMTQSGNCRVHGPDAWYNAMYTLLPAQRRKMPSGRTTMNFPRYNEALMEYWGIKIGTRETVLSLKPAQLQILDAAGCKKLSTRMASAANEIRQITGTVDETQPFLWLPFSVIP